MNEPTPQTPAAESIPAREPQEQHTKTIAVRVEESLHAQLQFIAQLNGTSLTEEIRQAIQTRIETAQDDPELITRAETARQAIEREAAARSAAIAGFLGKPAIAGGTANASKPRRSPKAGNE